MRQNLPGQFRLRAKLTIGKPLTAKASASGMRIAPFQYYGLELDECGLNDRRYRLI